MRLYHGTTSKDIKSILRTGLKTLRGHFFTPCFTDDKGTAANYAYEVYVDTLGGVPAIITINIPDRYVFKTAGPDKWQLSREYIREFGTTTLLPRFISKVEAALGEKGIRDSEVKYLPLGEAIEN